MYECLCTDIAASHATTQVDEKNTVLTVPYNFTKKQRNVISKCAELAGFHVVQVKYNNTTSFSLIYGSNMNRGQDFHLPYTSPTLTCTKIFYIGYQ